MIRGKHQTNDIKVHAKFIPSPRTERARIAENRQAQFSRIKTTSPAES